MIEKRNSLSLMSGTHIWTYRIDGDDCITYVSPEWLEFALENEAPHLIRPGVVGEPIWKYLTGTEVRHLYHVFLEKIRNDGAPLRFPFRCDSPGKRRFMEMEMRPGPGKEVEFACQLLREEPRQPVPLLDTAVAHSKEMIRMCSWCKRIATPEWRDIEDAIRHLRVFENEQIPQITHGICSDCRTKLEATAR